MQRIRKFSALAAICNITSILLLTVSLATVDWISGDFVGLLGADRGHVSFGLFKVTYLITARQQEETGTASGECADFRHAYFTIMSNKHSETFRIVLVVSKHVCSHCTCVFVLAYMNRFTRCNAFSVATKKRPVLCTPYLPHIF